MWSSETIELSGNGLSDEIAQPNIISLRFQLADPEVYLGVAEQWWKNSDFLKMWRFIVIRKQIQSENSLLRIWAYRILSKNRVFLVIFDDLSERDNR